MSEMFSPEDAGELLASSKKGKKRAPKKVSELMLAEARALVAEADGELVEEVKALKYSPGETRTITIQKGKGKGEGRAIPVSVQGKTYLVPRGKKIEVPAMVAEVLENAEETFHDWDSKSLLTDTRDALAYPISVHGS